MTSSAFARPHPVQFKGNRFAAWLLKRIGWKLKFHGLPTLQGVIAVYPHTSNWDFVVLIIAKWSIGIHVKFWAKATLFDIPVFGPWLRWLGGLAVDRISPKGTVVQTVAEFDKARANGQYMWLALAPEGTRKLIPGWRSGFYRTACQAKVPLGLVRFDWARKEILIEEFIELSGDEAQDFARIARVYEGVRGFKSGNAAPIRLLDSHIPRDETIVK
jgi:1-acyl-sn-glycerol-3-phosphate acyltransferase